MASSVFLFIFSFFSILILSSSTTTTTILTLSSIQTPKPSLNPWNDYISFITKSSLLRAHHLKHPHKTPSSHLHGSSQTPLFPRSYGGYTLTLAFGTPAQPIPLVFDTGSSLLWVPCTSNYTCTNCTFSSIDPTSIPTFKPKLSSTTRIVGCRNPKCGWLFGGNALDRCSDCPNPKVCTQPCPTYLLQYGLGATAGLAITDNLDLQGPVIPGFFFGCSLLSARQPEGIAGFGRAPTSLPNQLKLKKFSYCLLSHKFDDKPKSSNLTLTGKIAGKVTGEVPGVMYTPFVTNPRKSPYNEYYYVSLKKIIVGNKRVNLPYKFLRPDLKGNGGVIVDSGSTLTFMDGPVLGPLIKAMVAQTGHLKRAENIEAQTGFGLCYDVSDLEKKNVSIPGLVLYFEGRGKMELPLANYFSFINDSGSLCLTIISGSSPAGPSVPVGPAVILGNYLQQNFYVEYDLENQKFGFKKQKCG